MADFRDSVEREKYSYYFYKKRLYRATHPYSVSLFCEVLRSDGIWMSQRFFSQWKEMIPLETEEQFTRFLEVCEESYAALVVEQLV